jgi:integrase/recombinase XerC
MALRNFAEATRRGYGSDLRLFIGYLDEVVGIETVKAVERTGLRAYFAELDRRGLAGATRARKLAAIRSFFSYLESAGLAPASPVAGIPRPKQEVRQPRVLTELDYASLRAACQNHRRDRAIIELFLQTGLRLSEVAALRLCDLELPMNPEDGRIGAVRVTGKGRKQRTVTLNWKACQALGTYLDGRCTGEGPPVFLARAGRPSTRCYRRLAGRTGGLWPAASSPSRALPPRARP